MGVEKPGDSSNTVTATEQGTLRGLAQNGRGHDQVSTAALQHSAGGVCYAAVENGGRLDPPGDKDRELQCELP